MIASWPQAALRGGTSLANANSYSPVCSIGNPAIRLIRRGSPHQKTEAARSQEAAPVYLRPSTLPETWERSSLSDEGIREALRALTKHLATLEETDQADSATINPERFASKVSQDSLADAFLHLQAAFVGRNIIYCHVSLFIWYP